MTTTPETAHAESRIASPNQPRRKGRTKLVHLLCMAALLGGLIAASPIRAERAEAYSWSGSVTLVVDTNCSATSAGTRRLSLYSPSIGTKTFQWEGAGWRRAKVYLKDVPSGPGTYVNYTLECSRFETAVGSGQWRVARPWGKWWQHTKVCARNFDPATAVCA